MSSLSDRLQDIFTKLKGKGKLSEADVNAAMREVRVALLEADVNYKIAKDFCATVKERAIGEEVMKSLTPGQQVVKIVNEELTTLMGGDSTKSNANKLITSSKPPTVILMAGLQGSGKTTSAGKIALYLKNQGKRPLLAAGDVYRPAAIQQLEVLGQRIGVPVFSLGDQAQPVKIATDAVAHARAHGNDYLIIDTAGRLAVDEEMMQEISDIRAAVEPTEILLVIDAMQGQDAVNVAEMFSNKVGIDGVVLTKLDGDTRGGAALSIRAVSGKPILYVGMGEKLSDLEQFYPDRMASRILGMGDVLTLIEKAQESVDEEKAKAMEQKMKKAQFDFNDYLDSMEQMRNMGGISSILNMLPGVGAKMKGQDLESMVDEKDMARKEAIVLSMTPKERENPDLINPSRKQRIAKGAGVDIAEVNRFIKQFEQSRKMMKQMTGMVGKGGKRGGFKLPF